MSNKTEFFTIGPVPVAFPSIFTPSKPRGSNQEEKYNVNLLLTAEQYAQVAKPQLDALIAQAFPNGESANPQFKWPFYECKFKADTYPGGAEQNMLYGNAKSQFPIEVVEGDARTAVLDPNSIKDGSIVYASINFYPFNKAGNIGVGCGLGPVWHVGDGPALNVSGGTSADSAFGGIQVDTSVAPQAPTAAPSAPAAPTQAAPAQASMAPPPPPGS